MKSPKKSKGVIVRVFEVQALYPKSFVHCGTYIVEHIVGV